MFLHPLHQQLNRGIDVEKQKLGQIPKAQRDKIVDRILGLRKGKPPVATVEVAAFSSSI
jgi:hypothetical protein